MIKVVGVRFRKNGKIYYFDPTGKDVKKGQHVIVETARGVEYGDVVVGPKDVADDEIVTPLKPIIRIATKADDKQNADNREKEKKAFDVCLEKIAKHGLEMKLVDVEYTFDGNKILFYFTADGRIDFRELVKDLAAIYKTRIELRQIGVRDETKLMGGFGICGREYCCHSFQSEFMPVSIRMAKDQNLSLNMAKISGCCGRLMCCIKYEEDTYLELNKSLPHVGDETTTEDGLHGVVDAVNILRQKIRVIVDVNKDEREAREYGPGELKFTHKNRGRHNKQEDNLTPEELAALKELEKD